MKHRAIRNSRQRWLAGPGFALALSFALPAAAQEAVYVYTGQPFDIPACVANFGQGPPTCVSGSITAQVTFNNLPSGYTGLVGAASGTVNSGFCSLAPLTMPCVESFTATASGVNITRTVPDPTGVAGSNLLISFSGGAITGWLLTIQDVATGDNEIGINDSVGSTADSAETNPSGVAGLNDTPGTWSLFTGQFPVVAANGLVNGASFQTGAPVAAGSLVSIFGTALATGIAPAQTVPLPLSLGGVGVIFQAGSASYPAPLLYAQGDNPAENIGSQINAQVPWELAPPAGGTVTVNVLVTNNGVASASVPVTIGSAAPGIFALGTRAIVTNLDGSLTWTTGAVAGVSSHPAKAGDIVVVWSTGLGAVDTPIEDGANSLDQIRNTLVHPIVLIGGISAQVLFSGLSPNFVGLNQLNVQIPDVTPGDAVPIQIEAGDLTSPDGVTISITQ